MRALPLNIGAIHFVGIGGIGMSGIAEVLHTLGYQVQRAATKRPNERANSQSPARRPAGSPVAVGTTRPISSMPR